MIEGEGWVRAPEAAAPTRAAGLERRRLVGAVLASVALAACGGGGGSGEDVDTSSGGAGPGEPAGGHPSEGHYAVEAPTGTAAGDLAQWQQRAAQGYAWLGTVGTRGGESGHLYLKTNVARAALEYDRQAWDPADRTELTNALNARGAQGWRFKASVVADPRALPVQPQAVFVRAAAGGLAYHYEARTPQATVAAFLAELNAQGERGYAFRGGWVDRTGRDGASLYEKRSDGVRYAYRAETVAPLPGSRAALEDLLRREGRQAGRYLGTYAVGSGFVALFEQRSDDRSPIEYVVEAVPDDESLQDLQRWLNERAAAGLFHLMDLAIEGPARVRVAARQRVLAHPLSGPVYP